MQGYIFQTETEAINAQKACNNYYGIPKSPNDVTQNWCGYNYDVSGFWYITYVDGIEAVLGEATEFEVTVPGLDI